MRFLTPTVLLGMAAYVHHHNTTTGGRVLLFPFIDKIVPSSAGNPYAMGEASVFFLAGLGSLTLVLAIVSRVRANRARRAMLDD